jgi:hypothetical protein
MCLPPGGPQAGRHDQRNHPHQVLRTFGWLVAGQWSGHGAQIAASAALWILVPLAAGTVRTLRRDVP